MHKIQRPFPGRSLRNIALCLPVMASLASPLAAQSDYATPFAFTDYAGSGASGSADGTGAAARFNEPYGVALDSAGNLYVADKNNDTIRVITTAGAVTTLAGMAGMQGSTDATGNLASFDGPTGITVGSGGDLYVADSLNNTIRRVTSSGSVSTVAGVPGSAGSTDGPGSAALFSQPSGIAIDSTGNLFVTDFANNTIREITQAGVVTTLVGTAGTPGSTDSTGVSAYFRSPIGITIDPSGNLYVTDTGNNTIRKITPGGTTTTLAGMAGTSGTADGTGTAARFNSPRGITIDSSGNLYVADSGNSTIRKITAAGAVTTLAGSPGSFANSPGTGAFALFDVPVGIAVDGSGNLYVAQELGDIISKGAVTTTSIPVITGQPVSQAIAAGSTVAFHAASSGLPAPTYQWYFNGTALSNGGNVSGATGPTLLITGASAPNAGSYSFKATNSSGTVQSSAATLAISSSTDVGRLINISCRSQVGTGANILISGFVVGGAGTAGSEPLLVRASGPALAAFDVAGLLPDPELQIFSGMVVLGTNMGWGGNAAIASAASAVGAFPWTSPSSDDSALLESLSPGAYTAQISGQSGDTGVALVEVYDNTPSHTAASPRLINISARTQVGTGGSILIAGFVIGGSTSRTVLIRASGPALAAFNVAGTLPDPELQLYAGSSSLLAANDGWGGDPVIAAAAASVNAFAWTSPTSNDSALLVTLAPGAYTAQVSGASGDTGVALIEVYEVP
jgi:sugar lactone lactonase YvrE